MSTIIPSSNTPSTNFQKRSFLKTLALSFVLISFGSVGSIINSIIFGQPKNDSNKGFGSNGYGM